MEEKIKILLVDDHKIFLDGIKTLIQNNSNYQIQTVSDFDSAIDCFKKGNFDLVISDYMISNENTGVDLFKELSKLENKTPFILLTSYLSSKIANEAYKLKIDGYLVKTANFSEIKDAIKTVVQNGEMFYVDEVKDLLFKKKTYDESKVVLSKREIEILTLIAKENTSKQIAEKLFISVNTVETHRKKMMVKIGASNMIGLYKYAFKKNYI